MSEYQYYEFQAIDRPLSQAAQAELRSISSRAKITATSFINEYSYGDLKAQPLDLVQSYFDLHLYVANWGTHQVLMKLPKRLVDLRRIETFLHESDSVKLHRHRDHVILEVTRQEVETDGWVEGEGLLSGIAPLRSDLLGGDERMLYLSWLMIVEDDCVAEDTPEPLPGLGPLTGALQAFVTFFDIDPDLVAAAAERGGPSMDGAAYAKAARQVIGSMDAKEQAALLLRVAENDPLVATELRARVRAASKPVSDEQSRTAGDLLRRAEAIGEERKQAAVKAAAEAKRIAEAKHQQEREARLKALGQRGEAAWRDVEAEVERRNATGYDAALRLLVDLQVLAKQLGTTSDFTRRVATLRQKHATKGKFIARLSALLT
jgi:hypothetical protein